MYFAAKKTMPSMVASFNSFAEPEEGVHMFLSNMISCFLLHAHIDLPPGLQEAWFICTSCMYGERCKRAKKELGGAKIIIEWTGIGITACVTEAEDRKKCQPPTKDRPLRE